MNPEPTGLGAGAIFSILFLGGLFAVMAYFVWKAYQRPRQSPPPYDPDPKEPDSSDDDSAGKPRQP